MRDSVVSTDKIYELVKNALTCDICSRELIIKGIDYSYYYESED